jgi:hypothetical protein
MTSPFFQTTPQPDGSLQVCLPAGCATPEQRAVLEEGLPALYAHRARLEAELLFEHIRDFLAQRPWIESMTLAFFGLVHASLGVQEVSFRENPPEWASLDMDEKNVRKTVTGDEASQFLDTLWKRLVLGRKVFRPMQKTTIVSQENLDDLRDSLWEKAFKEPWSTQQSRTEAGHLFHALDGPGTPSKSGTRL